MSLRTISSPRGKNGEGGVQYDKKRRKWRSQFRAQGEKKWLGLHNTKEEAEQVLRDYRKNIEAEKEAAHLATPIQRNKDGTAVIEVKCGKRVVEVLVDDDQWHRLRKIPWSCEEGSYAKNKGGSMHEAVMGGKAAPGFVVDHINNDRYDNRRDNLRFATYSQNGQNRVRPATSKLPRGVFRTTQGRFRASICFERKAYSLGTFTTPEEAASAYDEKALELFGEHAKINAISTEQT